MDNFFFSLQSISFCSLLSHTQSVFSQFHHIDSLLTQWRRREIGRETPSVSISEWLDSIIREGKWLSLSSVTLITFSTSRESETPMRHTHIDRRRNPSATTDDDDVCVYQPTRDFNLISPEERVRRPSEGCLYHQWTKHTVHLTSWEKLKESHTTNHYQHHRGSFRFFLLFPTVDGKRRESTRFIVLDSQFSPFEKGKSILSTRSHL